MLSAYGSVQDHGLAKRACYGLVLREGARVLATSCLLRQCSEAAALVAHASRLLLEGCTIAECECAFNAGTGRGQALELRTCVVERSTRRLWADADRPAVVVWGEDTVSHVRTFGAPPSDDEDDDGGAAAGASEHIVPPSRPRGAEDDDSDSDDSLEDPAAFANMQALMEELDDAAMAAAASTGGA